MLNTDGHLKTKIATAIKSLTSGEASVVVDVDRALKSCGGKFSGTAQRAFKDWQHGAASNEDLAQAITDSHVGASPSPASTPEPIEPTANATRRSTKPKRSKP